MMFLHGLSWAQIIMFELGGLFQFFALCVFARERLEEHHTVVLLEAETAEQVRLNTLQRQESTHAQEVAAYEPKPKRLAPSLDGQQCLPGQRDPAAARRMAASMLKTAKVKFQQTFLR